MKNIFYITISQKAKKQIAKLPHHVLMKLNLWVEAVSHNGIQDIRKISGYHDEPLHGNRYGQRSIRLNRSYRAIYVELDDGQIQFIEILEVTKHEY